MLFHIRGARGRVRTEVRFVEQDDGPCAAVPHDGQIALNAPQIELAIQRAHHKHRIEIRGHNLFAHLPPGNFAGEFGPARQNVLDPRPAFFRTRHDRDPVSDRGKVFPADGKMLQLAGSFCQVLCLR